MRRNGIVLGAEVCVALSMVIATSMLSSAIPTSVNATLAINVAAITAALTVLGLFNVWLPRGDAVDTTVSLAFAAAIVLRSPAIAAVCIVVARLLVVMLRPKGYTFNGVVGYMARRTILTAAVYGFLHAVSSGVLFNLAYRPDAAQMSFILVSAILYVALDVVMEQAHSAMMLRLPVFSMIASAVRLQGWMLAAEMSTGALAVVMFPSLRLWGLIAAVALLLVTRQSFALLIEVRASYTATVEVLARSLEAYSPKRRGHAERVAGMVAIAARHIGFQGKALENMTYAALFHDVGSLGVDDEMEQPSAESAHVLEAVGFLSGAIPILRVLDAEGEGDVSLDEADLIGAYLIATFSAIDTELNLGTVEDLDRATAIGARLYAATRRNVDRVVGRVRGNIADGSLNVQPLSEVVR